MMAPSRTVPLSVAAKQSATLAPGRNGIVTTFGITSRFSWMPLRDTLMDGFSGISRRRAQPSGISSSF